MSQPEPARPAPALGVLLVNLGSPDSTRVADVRRYLGEFLWDRRVVEMARAPWWLLLNGIILRTRPARSAAAYRKIWSDQGSPLIAISAHQANGLRQQLDKTWPQPAPALAWAMRYGNPSIAAGLAELRAAGVERLLVLPLYPQYSATTVASVFDAVTRELQQWRRLPELRFVNGYHTEPAYIAALAATVREHWAEHGQAERLLLSFHGIPQDYADKGDPYVQQCQETAHLLAKALALPDERWALAFQSRFGRQVWAQPYTDDTLHAWGAAGVRSVQVLSPGFAADCLETLEEIAMENRELFLEAGGTAYRYIPCLNDRADHLEMLAVLIKRHCSGWPETSI